MKKLITSKLLLILLGLLFSTPLFSQQNSISGKVVDQSTGVALPYVSLQLDIGKGYRNGGQTDQDGLFELIPFKEDYILTATLQGYKQFRKEIKVTPGQSIKINISLTQKTAWESGLPFPEIEGKWEPVSSKFGNQSIDYSDKNYGSYIHFMLEEGTPFGKISWFDGCNNTSSLEFRRTEKKSIEVQQPDWPLLTTLAFCADPLDLQLDQFIRKLIDQEIKICILKGGTLLKLKFGKDRFVFRKKKAG